MTTLSHPSSIPSEAATRHFDPVLRPELKALYLARAERLRTLAQDHDLHDYLRLAADLAEAQAAIEPADPAPATQATPAAPTTSLDLTQIAADGHWLPHLDALLAAISKNALPDPVAPHLQALREMPQTARIAAAQALARGDFEPIPAALAPFLWAAFSREVAQVARALPLPASPAQEPTSCPICASPPVASLIHTGDRQGLRYLHCTLCECQWHMVRAKCTNCHDAEKVDYLSFDTTEAVVRAESCGACGGYLKVISQEQERSAEAVADDLATLVLDDAATAEGYHRTGFNPFALPQSSS